VGETLFFYGRFFHKHHRDLIADRIDKATIRVNTFQPCLLFVDPNFGFAFWTAEDLK